MKFSFKNRAYLLYISGFVVILFFAAVISYPHNRQSIYNQIVLGTTHQQEQSTELYFTNYDQLTKQLIVGKQYNGSFTIVNHTSKSLTYTYEILANMDGAVISPSSGSIEIDDKVSKSVPFTYGLNLPDRAVVVTIKLTNINQSINLHLRS